MKKLVAFCLVCIVMACSSEQTTNKPNNLIQESLFIDVLTEIQIAESAYLKSTDKPKNKKEQLALNTKAILADFKLSANAFDSSMLYYQQNPQLMMDIYDSVVVCLENKLANMENNKVKKTN
jgi:hypothetical protein